MNIATRVTASGVNALLVGEAIRLVRRTVKPDPHEHGVYDVEMEFESVNWWEFSGGHKTGNPDIVHDNSDPAKCACNRKPA